MKLNKMSALACEIIGTGDRKLENVEKNDVTPSKTIAKDIVSEIVDNVLDIVDDPSGVAPIYKTDKMSFEEFKKKHVSPREKSPSLIGTGDQKSNVNLEKNVPIHYHPPVEKKNRLTDLVKNSKQILQKIMVSESKMLIQEQEKKAEEEKVLRIIELDCVQLSDVEFKTKNIISPEKIPLPKNDSADILTPFNKDIGLDNISKDSEVFERETSKRQMTFPRASTSRAKAAFAAKCRTLKKEATNLKKKKWNVSSKIANFFRKRRPTKDKKEPENEEIKKKNADR